MNAVVFLSCLLGVAIISGAAAKSGCGNYPADIVFVLDESGSIYGPDFITQKLFVKDYMSQFDSDVVHFGIITFDHRVRNHMDLDDTNKNPSAVIDAINQRRGQTSTWKAIDEMRTQMSFRGGSVPKICIIITDGESSSPEKTKESAQNARNDGITIIAIGIMKKTASKENKAKLEAELRSIASKPTSEYYFFLEEYTELMNIGSKVLDKVCPTTTTTTTTPQPTLPQMMSGCASRGAMDIVWGLPEDLEGRENEKAVGFVNGVVKDLNLGADTARVGVISMNCNKRAPQIGLQKHDTYNGFSNDLEKRTRQWTESAVGEQLTKINGMMNSARQESTKCGVLIVDGSMTDLDIAKEQATIAEYSMEVLIIAVGADDNKLDQISDDIDVYKVANYDELDDDFKEQVKDWMCKAAAKN